MKRGSGGFKVRIVKCEYIFFLGGWNGEVDEVVNRPSDVESGYQGFGMFNGVPK